MSEKKANEFPNFMIAFSDKFTDPKSSMNPILQATGRNTTIRNIIMKQFKTCGRQKNLKATREKKRFCTQRMTSDFSLETMQTRRHWNKILKELKEKNCKPRILYLISSKNEGEICSDIKKKTKQKSLPTDPPPKEMLNDVLQTEEKLR